MNSRQGCGFHTDCSALEADDSLAVPSPPVGSASAYVTSIVEGVRVRVSTCIALCINRQGERERERERERGREKRERGGGGRKDGELERDRERGPIEVRCRVSVPRLHFIYDDTLVDALCMYELRKTHMFIHECCICSCTRASTNSHDLQRMLGACYILSAYAWEAPT